MFKSGYKLRISLASIAAILIAAYLTFFAVAPDYPTNDGHPPSWSQNATYHLHSILNILLILIGYVLGELAAYHPLAKTTVYKWLNVDVRMKDLATFSQAGFFLVLIFHLNSPLFADWFHMISTGWAISGLYLLIMGWFTMWSKIWWFFATLINASLALLLAGFVFKLTQVGYGEFALAVVGLIFIYTITRKA